jgi:Tfp pilus assembly protein FimV
MVEHCTPDRRKTPSWLRIICTTCLMLGLVNVQAQGREETPVSGPTLSPAAMEALERLIGRPVAGVPEARARGTHDSVVVQRGETLDTIMRRTAKNLPFRDEALRKAFIDLNPQAFTQGSPHRLQAGAQLRVPSLEDVLVSTKLIPARPALTPTATPKAEDVHHASTSGPDPRAIERRHWVRYP